MRSSLNQLAEWKIVNQFMIIFSQADDEVNGGAMEFSFKLSSILLS